MSTTWISDYVDHADFTGLFVEELGWNRPSGRGRVSTIEIDGSRLNLTEAATYKGVSVWVCPSIPNGQGQRLVDKALRKESAERVVIFHDTNRQVWRWPQTRDAAGAGTARLVAHEHIVGRPNEALRQRLQFIHIKIDEPDVTVLEVVRRLRKAFDSDKITKDFYSKFARQHHDLIGAIKGIAVSDKATKPELRWYGSILLNRLMFIYFMQRKGFLDGDVDYLRNRLNRIRELKRPGSFYDFYRDFLIPLFHEGLGSDVANRVIDDPAIRDLIGDIPYINGGIFSRHPLEITNDIRVPDKAFEKIFDFFDQWQWHLDDRPSGNPHEINPDVLGYIFEQFVNNREAVATGNKAASTNADKGAYYTKEDVTGYMTSSTLIPVFLERLQRQTGVNPWRLVAEDPDRYIWASVKHGCGEALPQEIAAEERIWPRPSWDSVKVPAEVGLPTESWWEVIDRRNHVDAVTAAARNGSITGVADCITNNLDLETLAIDTIDAIDSPPDVASAWGILSELRIIDPTCGSGAFLFSALNTLHRLYQATFEAASTHLRTSSNESLKEIVSGAQRHPSIDYFLIKYAAINNIYGVDIMPEAVEIARLRLFLKLISQVDSRRDIEPLPDLEFNIRSGNALVGAVTSDDIRVRIDMLDQDRVDGITTAAQGVADAYRDFAKAQTDGDHLPMLRSKIRLGELAASLKDEIDGLWFRAERKDKSIDHYRRRVSPFHWLAEFPSVISRGGFDVVLGNPPYVSRKKLNYGYSGFLTDGCPDIYAPCLERASTITSEDGRMAMIVPMNLAWGGEFAAARKMLVGRFKSIWASTYGLIPSNLFEGVGIRNTIIITGPEPAGIHTTSFNKWTAEFRPHLMPVQRYIRHGDQPEPWPKIGQPGLAQFAAAPRGSMGVIFVGVPTEHRLGFKQTAGYWLSVFVDDPPCLDSKRRPMEQTKIGNLFFKSSDDRFLALAIAASRTMFQWWIFTGDDFDVLGRQFSDFPLSPAKLSSADRQALVKIGKRLHKRLSTAGDHMLWTPYAGAWYCNFDLNKCRDITRDADDIIIRALGLEDQRPALELEYRRFMKNARERPGTVRGAQPDRDR